MQDYGVQSQTSNPEGIVKEPWVSVSGIGHSDIRGLGKETPSIPTGQWSAESSTVCSRGSQKNCADIVTS